jgi:hypothetical protein
MGMLNQGILPQGYFAEMRAHIGPRIEVDVANGVAVAAYTSATVQTMPAVFPDEFEVLVFDTSAGPTLVGAIELVSPGNKDRADARRAFAIKCANYLHQGIGLVVVDIVTSRHANLHDELIDVLRHGPECRFPGGAHLCCVSYRPIHSETDEDRIELRFITLAVGQALPVVPLALRNGPTVPVDLETSYTQARRRSRL